MIFFKDLNERLDMHEVATWAGLHENKSGFVLCPFHSDRHPSMRLYSKSAFCFSCGSWCDSIGLVAQVKDLSQSESARLLCEAFALPVEDIPFHSVTRKRNPRNLTAEMILLWSKSVKQLLTCYVRKQAQRGVFCDWAERILDEGLILPEEDFYKLYAEDWSVETRLNEAKKK